MYITVPMRNQKQRKMQRKHQESIFKQIQYNSLFQKFTQQDQLKRSNGFVAVKQKFLTDKQNFGSRTSCLTFRRESLFSDKFKKQRPSITSIISSKQNKNKFSKTIGQFFFNNKNNQVIEQRPSEQRQSQQCPVINQQTNNNVNRKTQQVTSQSTNNNLLSSTVFPFKKKKKHIKSHSNITLIDLKVQGIEQILKKSGRSQVEDFQIFQERQNQKLVTKGWKNFYQQYGKNLCSKNRNYIQGKYLKSNKSSTTYKKKTIVQNQIEDIFLQKKKMESLKMLKNCRSLNVSPRKLSQRQKQESQAVNSIQSTIQSEKMSNFYTFVKGGYRQDDFSSKISLKKYRKCKNKYYILKNIQNSIKNSKQYKKITIQNFHSLNPGEVLSFIYLNQNNYKLSTKKQENLVHLNQIIP